MDQAEKTRVEKLLGMLGSSFDGERANAAAMLTKMAASKKLSINELVAEAIAPAIATQSQPPPYQPPRQARQPDFSDLEIDEHLSALRTLSKLEGVTRILTPWEMQFVLDITIRYGSDGELSEKQLIVTKKILRKAARAYT